MERPDLRKFNGKVLKKDEKSALKLLFCVEGVIWLNLVLVKVRNEADDDPWQTPAKVHHFVENKTHKPCVDNVSKSIFNEASNR